MPRSDDRYDPVPLGPDGWTAWSEVHPEDHRLACCDCGLVHMIRARIRRGKVVISFKRNDRSTSALRRHRAFACRPR